MVLGQPKPVGRDAMKSSCQTWQGLRAPAIQSRYTVGYIKTRSTLRHKVQYQFDALDMQFPFVNLKKLVALHNCEIPQQLD
jgi:hypothetical protein